MNPPEHVAIIMDGNGRWAVARGHSRTYGHVRGAQVARKIIREAGQIGIKYLTLYTFSSENWNRPAAEVDVLMRILEKYLKKEQTTLMADNVRFRCVGDISKLPTRVIKIINETVKMTSDNTGLNLVFALNYSGRQEIVRVMRDLSVQIKEGHIRTKDINEELVASLLDSSFMPDPDLIIRTSGEQRISNFFLWQAAYSEFYFTPTPWPDFKSKDLHLALESFGQRDRRFGRVSSQVPQSAPNGLRTTLRGIFTDLNSAAKVSVKTNV